MWRYDPLPAARSIRTPVLLVHGDQDDRVSVDQSDTLAAAFREGGNEDVTVKIFPGINHFLVPKGTPRRMAQVGKDILGVVADWVEAEFGSWPAG